MTIFHTITGLLSLISGLALVLLPKGARLHKGIGKVYVISMYALCLTSFAITDTTPYFKGYGIFHLIAAVGIVYLTIGMIPLLFRRRMRDWFAIHFYCMLWSYVGLVMALNAHFFPNVLYFLSENLNLSRRAASIASMLLLWGVPLVIGNILINRKMPQYKNKFSRKKPLAKQAVSQNSINATPR
jgi:uncharacterized membrane protein